MKSISYCMAAYIIWQDKISNNLIEYLLIWKSGATMNTYSHPCLPPSTLPCTFLECKRVGWTGISLPPKPSMLSTCGVHRDPIAGCTSAARKICVLPHTPAVTRLIKSVARSYEINPVFKVDESSSLYKVIIPQSMAVISLSNSANLLIVCHHNLLNIHLCTLNPHPVTFSDGKDMSFSFGRLKQLLLWQCMWCFATIDQDQWQHLSCNQQPEIILRMKHATFVLRQWRQPLRMQ